MLDHNTTAPLREYYIYGTLSPSLSRVSYRECYSHSRYCDHLLSKEIDEIVYRILKDLQRFQTRAYNENPIKVGPLLSHNFLL